MIRKKKQIFSNIVIVMQCLLVLNTFINSTFNDIFLRLKPIYTSDAVDNSSNYKIDAKLTHFSFRKF